MNKQTQKYIILFNLIAVLFLFLDVFIPGKVLPIEELESFHSTQRYFGSGNRTGYEIINIVELKNGQLYRIGKQPLQDYKSGQKIKIIKSPLFSKVNEVFILDKNWIYLYVGFVSKRIVFALLIVSIGLSIASRYSNNSIINLGLFANMLGLFVTNLIYLFVY